MFELLSFQLYVSSMDGKGLVFISGGRCGCGCVNVSAVFNIVNVCVCVCYRTLGASSPDLLSLDSPTHIMKLLTNNISASQSQEVLDLNRKLSPLCPPKQTSPGPQTYIQPAESYDKQVINTIFDSLLHTAYPAVTTEGVSEHNKQQQQHQQQQQNT